MDKVLGRRVIRTVERFRDALKDVIDMKQEVVQSDQSDDFEDPAQHEEYDQLTEEIERLLFLRQ